MKTYKGYFKPKNPDKYKGNPTNIIYRSSWELKFMLHLDHHDDVIKWSSEEVVIPYISPIDGKVHRYFVDFLVTKKNKLTNKVDTILVEIKPYCQTIPPQKQEKVNKRYLAEVKTWGVNDAKWRYAREYCKDRGWNFEIFTEKELGIK